MDNNVIKSLKITYPKFHITELSADNLKLQPEKCNGFIEYKRTLVDCPKFKSVKYATQMRWRMTENRKRMLANYYIGVDDDGSIIGLPDNELLLSIANFVVIAESIEASIIGIKIINVLEKKIIFIGVKNKKIRDSYLVDL